MLNLRVEEIEEAFATFKLEARKAAKGNKAAGGRARKATLELEKLLKQFRKESIPTKEQQP